MQGWLNQIGTGNLSRNTLKHVKSVVSGIFTLAKQQDYFQGENPAASPRSILGCRAYALDEIKTLCVLPAATAFAVAAFMGLRHGEIQGLLWEDYREGAMHVSRSIRNGRVSDPKTRKGRAPVPVIRQLAQRLEMHRMRCGNPQSGPIFTNRVLKKWTNRIANIS
jgi:integrase